MKENSSFSVLGIGNLTIIASLLTIDYPRIFVATKINLEENESDLLLYIFEEIKVDESSATWAVSQISFSDLDELNRGLRTVQDCFRGSRGQPKKGFIVTSKEGAKEATSEIIDNIYPYIQDGSFYPDPFVEDQHGSGIVSLVNKSKFFSVVLEDSPNASPFISSERIQKALTKYNTFFSAVPYAIKTKNLRTLLSFGHSIVLSVEISDDYLGNGDKFSLFDNNGTESNELLDAMKTCISPKSSNIEIMNAFKGDKDVICKYQAFVREIRKNNSSGKTIFQFVDSQGGKSSSVIIDNQSEKIIYSNMSSSIQELEKAKQKTSVFKCTGVFLMLDTTGKRRFKFKPNDTRTFGNLFKGFAASDFNPEKLTLNLVDENYNATFLKTIFCGDFGETKPIFSLTKLERGNNDEQLRLVDQESNG
jgi:hypothetical protein